MGLSPAPNDLPPDLAQRLDLATKSFFETPRTPSAVTALEHLYFQYPSLTFPFIAAVAKASENATAIEEASAILGKKSQYSKLQFLISLLDAEIEKPASIARRELYKLSEKVVLSPLEQLGKVPTPVVQTAFEGTYQQRYQCLALMDQLRDARIVPVLFGMLRTEDETDRRNAALYLTHYADKLSLAHVVALEEVLDLATLIYKDLVTEARLVKSIGEMREGGDALAKLLTQRLSRDESLELQCNAAEALARVGDSESLEALRAALANPKSPRQLRRRASIAINIIQRRESAD